MFDRKHHSKHPEKRNGRSLDMQAQQYLQLQEELRRARDEKTRALEDLEELRSNKRLLAHSNREEMEVLEKKAEKAKESERKMLESLVSLTKQLEQTKILLEEAKIEMKVLKDGVKSMEEESTYRESQEKQRSSKELTQAHEEITKLRNELKLATQAEEKSKKAMDDFAVALKEVTTEAKQAKTRLKTIQTELDKAKLEAEQAKSSLQASDAKLRAIVDESEKVKVDSEDLVSVWQEKETGLLSCMKVSEEELANLKVENIKLIESLRGSRDETSKLRDIVKQAVNESTVVKETLEIVRTENSQLKDSLGEKESALQRYKQEYESLKVSEAAAVDSVNELKGFLAATSSVVDCTVRPTMSEVIESNNNASKIPSGRVSKPEVRKPRHGRRHSVGGGPGMFNATTFVVDHPQPKEEDEHPKDGDEQPKDGDDHLFLSLSNMSDARVPSSLYGEEREIYGSIDFDHMGGSHSNDMHYDNGQKKKRHMLRRFGDILRRRSFHSNTVADWAT